MEFFQKKGTNMIIGLSLQFLLGIAVNLYVKFPETGTAGQMWEAAKSQPLFWAHMIFGTLILLNSIFLVYKAFKLKNEIWKKVTIIAAISIFVSVLAGERFVTTQNDIFSLLMATGFIVSLLSYFWGVYSSK